MKIKSLDVATCLKWRLKGGKMHGLKNSVKAWNEYKDSVLGANWLGEKMQKQWKQDFELDEFESVIEK